MIYGFAPHHYDRTSKHHPQAAVAEPGLSKRWRRSSHHLLDLPVQGKAAIFELVGPSENIFMHQRRALCQVALCKLLVQASIMSCSRKKIIKIFSDGPRIIALTNKHTHPPTDGHCCKQQHLRDTIDSVAEVLLFTAVSVCGCVCMFVCQRNDSWTVRDIFMIFYGSKA